LRQSTLAQWILRTLDQQGPQDFGDLMKLLKSDPEFGYVPLGDSSFESKLRSCLSTYSQANDQLFIQAFNYKWKAFKEATETQLDIPRKARAAAWLTLGQGHELVYGIFCPQTMRESLKSKISCYPIKVGRTSRPISERLIELQTGNFMDLQIGILIKTDSSQEVERYLHSQLIHRKISSNASQNEWFLTSLEKLSNLYCEYLLLA